MDNGDKKYAAIIKATRKRFGKYLSAIRKKQKKSQTDVGAEINMNKQQVSKIEQGGYVEMDPYIKEAAALNVAFEDVASYLKKNEK